MDDLKGQGRSWQNLGRVLRRCGRFDEALAVHREEARIHRELDLPLGVAENIANEALVPGEARRTDEALATWRRALALFTEEGVSGVTESLNAIGLLSLDLADFEALEHAHKESADLFTRIGATSEATIARDNASITHRRACEARS